MTESRWDRLEKEVFEIRVSRNCASVLVGNCSLETAKKIHGDHVQSIFYDSKIVILNPETTPYGK